MYDQIRGPCLGVMELKVLSGSVQVKQSSQSLLKLEGPVRV